MTTPQLGAATWQRIAMNQVELNHANLLCTDLEKRTWWAQ
jgi:hypothetical protein